MPDPPESAFAQTKRREMDGLRAQPTGLESGYSLQMYPDATLPPCPAGRLELLQELHRAGLLGPRWPWWRRWLYRLGGVFLWLAEKCGREVEDD